VVKGLNNLAIFIETDVCWSVKQNGKILSSRSRSSGHEGL
jgi:hypothetical protein